MMWGKLPIRQIHFRTHLSDCSCKCRFCCLGDNFKEKTSFSNYAKIVRKFAPYCSDRNIKIRSYVYNSLEYRDLKNHIDLCREIGMPHSQTGYFDINGTRIRSDEKLPDWINDLKSAGMESAGITWFGLSEYHDSFVGREGYFKYLYSVANILQKYKIPVKSKIFITPAMLNSAMSLIEKVKPVSNLIQLGMVEYTGYAKTRQDLFLEKSMLKDLPLKITRMFGVDFSNTFKSESEWVHLAKSGDYPRFTHRDLVIYVHNENINELLYGNIEKPICHLEALDKRVRRSYPSVEELAASYGDGNSEILLEWRDVLRKWLDKLYSEMRYDKNDLFSLTRSCVEWKINPFLYTNGNTQ